MASIAGLVPKLESQGDYTWDSYFKPVLREPGKYSLSEIISKLESNITWYDEERKQAERRQVIWILALLLFHQGWDTHENRERVLDLVNEWDIDESVFLEMKDTAQTYKSIADYERNIDDWDVQLKQELANNKKDLSTSIKNLIELG